MQLDRGTGALDGLAGNLLGHGCIVLAVCLLAALISFPTGW
jgi:hypothetical protein